MKLVKGYTLTDTWGAQVTWMGDCPQWFADGQRNIRLGHQVPGRVMVLKARRKCGYCEKVH